MGERRRYRRLAARRLQLRQDATRGHATHKRRRVPLWGRAVSVILGGLAALSLGGMAVADATATIDLSQRGVVTTGVVVDAVDDFRGPHHVTVRFVAGDGQEVQAETERFRRLPKVGASVQIRYDPNDPTTLESASYPHDYWDTVVEGALAVAMLLLVWAVLTGRGPDWLHR